MRKCLVLWLRLGDVNEYESFDGVDEVVDALRENGVRGPFNKIDGGLVCPGFEAANYISLFWGPPSDPNWERQLRVAEFADIVRGLKPEAETAAN